MKALWVLLAVALVVALFSVGMTVVSLVQHEDDLQAFRRHCDEAGGHLYGPDLVLCLDADGRIVEVYP